MVHGRSIKFLTDAQAEQEKEKEKEYEKNCCLLDLFNCVRSSGQRPGSALLSWSTGPGWLAGWPVAGLFGSED
jgi:hypothetical protein